MGRKGSDEGYGADGRVRAGLDGKDGRLETCARLDRGQRTSADEREWFGVPATLRADWIRNFGSRVLFGRMKNLQYPDKSGGCDAVVSCRFEREQMHLGKERFLHFRLKAFGRGRQTDSRDGCAPPRGEKGADCCQSQLWRMKNLQCPDKSNGWESGLEWKLRTGIRGCIGRDRVEEIVRGRRDGADGATLDRM